MALKIAAIVQHYMGVQDLDTGHNISCPFSFHEDIEPSFHIYEDTNTFKCFGCGKGGGPLAFIELMDKCSPEEAIDKLRALEFALQHDTSQPYGLDQYCKDKALDRVFLVQKFELDEHDYYISMPYKNERGKTVARRYRSNSRSWTTKGGLPIPYGLWCLDGNETEIVLVEGESDCQTLTSHGISALGIPGAGSWREGWCAYLPPSATIYISREPDEGGALFERILCQVLPPDHLVKIIEFWPGIKDPNDLHRQFFSSDAFLSVWTLLKLRARERPRQIQVAPVRGSLVPTFMPKVFSRYPALLAMADSLMQHIAPSLSEIWRLAFFLGAWSVFWPHLRIENLGANLWVLGLGIPSQGKSLLMKLIRDIIVKVAAERRLALTTYTSGSPEGMLESLQSGLCLGYMEEFTSWIQEVHRHGGYVQGMQSTLSYIYDGTPVRHLTRKTPIKVDNPYFSWIAVDNLDPFLKLAIQDFIQGGFLSRWWIIKPDWVELCMGQWPPDQAVTALVQRLTSHIPEQPEVIKVQWSGSLSPQTWWWEGGATGQLVHWQRTNWPDPTPIRVEDAQSMIRNPVGRNFARIKKIAALLELLEEEPNLATGILTPRSENVELAIALIDKSRTSAQIIQDQIMMGGEARLAQEVLQRLHIQGILTEYQLMKTADYTSIRQLKEVLGLLERSGEVSVSISPGGNKVYGVKS